MPRRYTGPGAKFIYRKSFYEHRFRYILAAILIIAVPVAIRIWITRPNDSVKKEKTVPIIKTSQNVVENIEDKDFKEKLAKLKKKAQKVDYKKMVKIPAGQAIIGSEDISRGEQVHLPFGKRYVKAFYIDQTEVTQEDYKQCIEAGDCSTPLQTKHIPMFDEPDRPVVVSFKQAVVYCTWAGKRLPTEVEWEKAARGENGRLYPWGNETPDSSRGNVCGAECPVSTTIDNWLDLYPYVAPVGQFPAGDTPNGVTDMAGNLREWVVSDRVEKEGWYVARGASWCSRDFEMMGSYRHFWNENVREDDLGLRCAADVPEE